MDEQRAGRQLHRYRSRIAELVAVLEELAVMAEGDAALFSEDSAFRPFYLVHAEKIRAAIKRGKRA